MNLFYVLLYGGRIIWIFVKQYIKYHFTDKVVGLKKNYSLRYSLTTWCHKFYQCAEETRARCSLFLIIGVRKSLAII